MSDLPGEQLKPPDARRRRGGFLWTALLCLLAALIAGVLTARARGGLSRLGIADVILLTLAGLLLLLAHFRSRAWIKTAETVTQDAPDAPISALDTAAAAISDRHSSKHELLAIGLVTLLGAGLRLIALRHSLWYDELWTMGFMRNGPVYALTHQGSYNNHLLNSFLGSLLLRLRLLLLGLTPSNGAPAYWVRLPSFLFGAASVPMLYAAVRAALTNSPEPPSTREAPHSDDAISGQAIALLAAFLLAVSPSAIDLSAQTRGYAGVLFCGIAQAFFLARVLRLNQPSAWLGWLLCAFVGVFAHLYMLFIVFVNSLLLLALIAARLIKKEPGKSAGHLMEQGVLMLVAWLCLMAVCYSGVVYKLREEFGRVYENGPMARAHEVVVPTLQLWGGLPTGAFRMVFYAISGLLIAFGLFFLARFRPSVAAYLLGMLLVPPILVEIAHPHFVYPRFFAFALPAFLTLLVCGLWQTVLLVIGANAERRAVRIALLSALGVAFLSLTLPGLRAVLLLPKQDYKNAARQLRHAQRDHIAVAVIGGGCEYFKPYGVRPFYPHSPEELAALVKANGTLLVGDTDITINKRMPPPLTTQWVRQIAGPPIAVYPGRFADWPHRWLDGDSDVKIYELHAHATARSRGL